MDALVNASSGDLITVRPLAEAAVGSVVGSPPFRRVAALAAADAHREVIDGDTSLLIELGRGAPLFAEALRALGLEVAASTPADTRPVVAELKADERRQPDPAHEPLDRPLPAAALRPRADRPGGVPARASTAARRSAASGPPSSPSTSTSVAMW